MLIRNLKSNEFIGTETALDENSKVSEIDRKSFLSL